MQIFSLLGYKVVLLESTADVTLQYMTLPNKIGVFGFDTETNTKINMAKRDENLIDIMHDKLFLLQFGFGTTIYLCDIRNKSNDCITSFIDFYDKCITRSSLAVAHNIKFDISMLMNLGYVFHTSNLCDTQAIARLALESKSEREGGYPMALKPLCKRLLGSIYTNASAELDEYLEKIWTSKLKDLAKQLKPYGISRVKINEALKDVTGSLDEFPIEVQHIWNHWEMTSKVSYDEIPPDLIYKYGGADVILLLELVKLLLPIVKDKNQIPILKREMRLLMPLVGMERTGYTVDKSYLIKCKQALIFEINYIQDINTAIAGCKIGYNKNLAIKKMILNKYNYNLESTDKNKIHIAIQSDSTMPDDVKKYLDNVLYLRTLSKWISTYINPILYKLNAGGGTKVYTQYNPNGAVSGRFTSNFQQFPKQAIRSRIGDFELFNPRKMFIVDADYPEMAYIDYSQVELRLQAEYTYYCTKGYGDINMIRAYRPFKCHEVDGKWYHDEDNVEWQGVDLHTQSTLSAFPDLDINSPEFKTMRKIGKRVNFALIYGASLKKVQETLADCDPNIVEKLYKGFHSRFKDVATYSRYVTRMWINNGGYVTNLLGRRYYLNESKDVYKLNNYLIQGSAADIIKLVIIQVDKMLKKYGYKTRLQGCIHDELCICVAEGEHDVIYKIKKIMETTVKTFVPLVAEIEITNTNWAEKHEEGE